MSLATWLSLAMSGLALVWSAAWSVWLYRRETRASVRVDVTFAMPVGQSGPGPHCLAVDAVNVGRVPVTLNSASLSIPGTDERLAVPQWLFAKPFPVRLEPSDSWSGMVEVSAVMEVMRQRVPPERYGAPFSAIVRDSARRAYRGKITLDASWWSK